MIQLDKIRLLDICWYSVFYVVIFITSQCYRFEFLTSIATSGVPSLCTLVPRSTLR